MSLSHQPGLSYPLPQRHRQRQPAMVPGRSYLAPDLARNLCSDRLRIAIPTEVALAKAPDRGRFDLIEQELAALKKRVALIESRTSSCEMEIRTFAPALHQVKKPIPIVVRPHDGIFMASFMDANVNASGETEQEAFEAVKLLILDMLEQLERQPKLGPRLAVRLAVLREFVGEP